MKKIVFAAISAAALAFTASPAMAAVIDISSAAGVSQNIQGSAVSQVGAAVNASIGGVVGSNLDVDVTNAVNVATTTLDVDQSDSGLVNLANLSGATGASLNASLAPVSQIGLAGNLTGGLLNSNVGVGVTNALNVATVDITVKQ